MVLSPTMHTAIMTREALLAFMRSERYAVQASVTPDGAAQAAVVGIAVSDAFEIVFDTVSSSRKAKNLQRQSAIAFVIGGTRDGDERTVQYEGIAALPAGDELQRARELYFSVFPDGRDRLAWPGLIHIRVTPVWIRYSNFNAQPPEIVEFKAEALR
jgi:general stress protein 26